MTLAAKGAQTRYLSSGVAELDDFLQGGLPIGALTEWGMPLGCGGRDLLLLWLSELARGDQGQPAWVLWIHSKSYLTVYPPAWMARGVAFEHLRFACTGAPLSDLRPVFLEPLFRMIIIDTPQDLSQEDCGFIARQARRLGLVIILIRDHFIGQNPLRTKDRDSGSNNVWARLRLNGWRCLKEIQTEIQTEIQADSPKKDHTEDDKHSQPTSDYYCVEALRGLPRRRLLLKSCYVAHAS